MPIAFATFGLARSSPTVFGPPSFLSPFRPDELPPELPETSPLSLFLPDLSSPGLLLGLFGPFPDPPPALGLKFSHPPPRFLAPLA